MEKERKEKHFIQKPIYEGGLKAMKSFIKENLQYPKAALDSRIEGTVSLRYTINHKGKVVKVKIISGIGYGCDQEAERLVKELVFSASKNRGKRMVFHKSLQIHFRLPKKKTLPKLDVPPTPETKAPEVEPQIHYNYVKTDKKPRTDKKPPKSSSGYSITIDY